MLDSLSEWILAAGFVTLIAYLLGTWTHNHFYNMNVFHIKPIPFFGNMAPVVLGWRSFPDFINDLYKKLKGHKYGGVYQFMTPLIVITDPELIKTIAIKDFEFFLDHSNTMDEDFEPLMGKGLFHLKGQKWKDMRSTLSPAFTSSKMKTMFTLITECGEQLGDFLKTCIKDKNMPVEGCKIEREGDMLVVELKDLFTRYTNDVIATSAFGIGCDSLNKPKNEFYEMMKDLTNFGGVRALIVFAFMFSPKLVKMLNLKSMSKSALNFFRNLMHDTMATREAKDIFRPDLVHILMQAKKETVQPNGTTGLESTPKWEDDDLTAQAVNFFFAGFDMSSTLLCFASHLLATHPDIQSRLQKEIDEILENDEGKLTYEAVHSMKYLDMVVSETLRMYPPLLGIDRKCIKTYTFKTDPPCTVEPGDSVWIPVYCLHHDPKYFPKPEKFDPERFSDVNKDNINQYAYLPFGLGPRSCIGNRFALMEAKIALVHLLTRFNLKVVAKTPIPIQITKRNFTMTVDGGFWLGLEQKAT
ncbi:cytochrome P450 9e2-like [Periplaneta americana]|uniref:cytochrome P450 9e2-like n=1 Tax=Periplaneta americana TaxID=6978 RepID=UPI0037E98D56